MPRTKTYTIEAALDGALEAFVEYGYRGTTMEAIAKHLKLSRSAVYFTFRSKPALFVQALRRYNDAWRTPGLSALSRADSPRAALVRALEAVAAGGKSRSQARLYLLIEAAFWLQHEDPKIAGYVGQTVLDLEGRFRDAIERGQTAGEIADHVDSVTTARVLLGLYFGLFVIAGSCAKEERLGAVLQQVEALLPTPGEV